MAFLCPLCNGLEIKNIPCEKCGGAAEDIGAVRDYFDSYSPYLDFKITNKLNGVPPDQCLHVFRCRGCGLESKIAIGMVEL